MKKVLKCITNFKPCFKKKSQLNYPPDDEMFLVFVSCIKGKVFLTENVIKCIQFW